MEKEGKKQKKERKKWKRKKKAFDPANSSLLPIAFNFPLSKGFARSLMLLLIELNQEGRERERKADRGGGGEVVRSVCIDTTMPALLVFVV